MSHRHWTGTIIDGLLKQEIMADHNQLYDAWRAKSADATRLGRDNDVLCDKVFALEVKVAELTLWINQTRTKLQSTAAKSARRRVAIKQLQRAHDGWQRLAKQYLGDIIKHEEREKWQSDKVSALCAELEVPIRVPFTDVQIDALTATLNQHLAGVTAIRDAVLAGMGQLQSIIPKDATCYCPECCMPVSVKSIDGLCYCARCDNELDNDEHESHATHLMRQIQNSVYVDTTPDWTDAQIEALAKVLDSVHKTQWSEEKGYHNNYDDMARVAFATINPPEGE